MLSGDLELGPTKRDHRSICTVNRELPCCHPADATIYHHRGKNAGLPDVLTLKRAGRCVIRREQIKYGLADNFGSVDAERLFELPINKLVASLVVFGKEFHRHMFGERVQLRFLLIEKFGEARFDLRKGGGIGKGADVGAARRTFFLSSDPAPITLEILERFA